MIDLSRKRFCDGVSLTKEKRFCDGVSLTKEKRFCSFCKMILYQKA